MRTSMFGHSEITLAWERYQDILDHAAHARSVGDTAPARRSVRVATGTLWGRVGREIAGAMPPPMTAHLTGAKIGGAR